MRLNKRQHGTLTRMNMTPMIDIVFLLIIFFMTVSQASKVNQERMSLPEEKGTDDKEPSALVINILQDGQLVIMGKRATSGRALSIVSAQLERVGDDRLKVELRVDRRCESKHANDLAKSLEGMGIKRVGIHAQTPQ